MEPDGFERVGTLADFPEGRARAARVGAGRVAVFRRGDRLWAIDDACPHMGASLADGFFAGERVTCYWHGWTFDLATGASGSRSEACARVWDVRVVDDEVWVRPRPEPDPEPVEDDPWVPFDPERHLRGD